MFKKLSGGLLGLALAVVASSLWSAEDSSNITSPTNNIYVGGEIGFGTRCNLGYENKFGKHFGLGGEVSYSGFGGNVFGFTAFSKYYFSKHKMSGWYVTVSGEYLALSNPYNRYIGESDNPSYLQIGSEQGYQWLFFRHATLSLSTGLRYGFALFTPPAEWNFLTGSLSNTPKSNYMGMSVDLIRLKLGWAF